MRIALLLLALPLGACTDLGQAMSGGRDDSPDGSPGDPGMASCLVVQPTTLSLSADEPEAEVVLSIDTEDCIEPVSHVEGIELDDPSHAFQFDVPEADEVTPEHPIVIPVRLLATDPGTYEAQLAVHTVLFDISTDRVQLFGQVP